MQGLPGPPGPASQTRIIRANCALQSCTVQCEQDEVLVTAYCGIKRRPATFLTDTSVSCGITPSPADNPPGRSLREGNEPVMRPRRRRQVIVPCT
jgi:hypothetical protein